MSQSDYCCAPITIEIQYRLDTDAEHKDEREQRKVRKHPHDASGGFVAQRVVRWIVGLRVEV